jgi:hypothetical protein
MNYTLQFGLNGNLNGWQKVTYELNGQKVEENQFFINGRSLDDMAFVTVSGVGARFYSFSASVWGTVEIMRDAAEGFAADCFFNVKFVKTRIVNRLMVCPNTEEAFV